jgi:small GTP-binding protein
VNKSLLLTPSGPAAIAVIRLTGPKTPEFLTKFFSRPTAAGRPIHGNLHDGDRLIDDPLVILHPDGITVDLNIHGGPWVVRQVMELAEREGFTPTSTTPPSPDKAVDGDDEIEQQVLSHLPLARTELALRWLLAQPPAWRRVRTADRFRRNGPHSRPHDESLYWLLHPPSIAIIGPPNAGKSTLANHLFAQDRSITADLPGTTRDWVGEFADIDGLPIFLMDTPGLRPTDDPIERTAIEQSRPQIRQADLIVLVVDATTPIEDQHHWGHRFPGALVVRNKCDQSPDPTPIDAARPHHHTVATTGAGIDLLRQSIRRRFIRPWRHLTRRSNFTTPFS